MKAKKKKVETLKPEDLGLDFVRYTRAAGHDAEAGTLTRTACLCRLLFSLTRPRCTAPRPRQTPDMEVLGVTEPPKRVGGGKVESIDELVAKLKDGGLL